MMFFVALRATPPGLVAVRHRRCSSGTLVRQGRRKAITLSPGLLALPPRRPLFRNAALCRDVAAYPDVYDR